jgi:CHAT domain-containing protein
MVAEEVAGIQGILPKSCLLELRMPGVNDSPNMGPHVTVDNVMAHLPDASVLHLACHAYQDAHDPLASGFFLHDGTLTIAEVMRRKMPNAFFAFLSACESASGSEDLPDEMVNISSAMLFTGFRSVIGTMW